MIAWFSKNFFNFNDEKIELFNQINRANINDDPDIWGFELFCLFQKNRQLFFRKKKLNMKIFITSSSGFIGYHLSKKLLDLGNTVHGYDSMNNYYVLKLKKDRLKILKKYKKFSFTKGKLENHKLLEKTILKFKPKIIIHLAAQAGVRYSIKS